MLTVPAHSCAGFSDINICYNTVMKNRDLSIDEPVVQNGDPVLRKKASAVAPELIGGKTLQGEIQKMKDVLKYEYDGVAIAAPQLGYSRRLFVVSGRVFQEKPNDPMEPDMVCINPEIIKTSSKTTLLDEGCLSVRYHYGQVKRHLQVTIQYIDENGISRVRGAGGFLAHVIQHEIDHLEGILFIDKAHNLEVLSGKDKKQLDRQRQNHIEQLQKHGK